MEHRERMFKNFCWWIVLAMALSACAFANWMQFCEAMFKPKVKAVQERQYEVNREVER